MKLGEVVKINPESLSKSYPYQEIQYVDISSVGTGALNSFKTFMVEDAPSRARRLVKHGDTIVSTVRPNLRSFAYIKNPPTNMIVSTGFAVLRPRENIDSRYLYYTVSDQSFTDYLVSRVKGSAYPAVDVDTFMDAEISLPPLPTQHKIAAILSAYDDLIENNNRRIKIIEEMAQLLYTEWFVNFRFPGHEYIKMVESELGLIPEGWEAKPFSEVVLVNPSIKVDKYTVRPYVDMASLSEFCMIVDCRNTRQGNNGSKFQNGDTLFARITPCLENGKTGFVQFLDDHETGLGSTEFYVLRSIALSPEFVYLLARTDEFRDLAAKSMTGASGRQRVQKQFFDQYKLSTPPEEILNKFSLIVKPLFRLNQQLYETNQNLRTTRDLLLPKLISGELDVEDLDIDVGEMPNE